MEEEKLEELVLESSEENEEIQEALEKAAAGLAVGEPNSSFQDAYVTEEAVQESVMDIAQSLMRQERLNTKAQAIREAMIDKLMPIAMSMKIDPNAKNYSAEETTSKMSILGELRSLVNDMEKSAKDMTSTHVKVKDLETNKNNSISAAEFFAQLKAYNNSGTVVINPEPQITPEEISAKLDEIMSDGDMVINDSELTTGGSQLPKEEETDD